MNSNIGITTRSAWRRTVEVRWSALRSRWRCDADDLPTGRCAYTRAEFVIRLTLLDDEHGMIDVWIETDDTQRAIRESVSVRCTCDEHEDLLHVCAWPSEGAADGPLLRVTFRETGDLLFAQSPLLAEAGWRGGTYDPPTGRCRDHEHAPSSEREIEHIAER